METISVSQKSYLIPLLLGGLMGILLPLDPYITTNIARTVDVTIFGTNILKLYPYELSSMLLFFLLLVLIVKKMLVKVYFYPEKAFIIIFIITSQTIALHSIGTLDGADLTTGIGLTLFLIQMMVRNEKLSITLLDIFNLLLLSFIILSSVNGGLISLLKASVAFKIFILSFLITNFVYKQNLVRFFIKWLIIVTSISAVIAILQEIIFMSTSVAIVGLVKKEELKFMFEETSLGTLLRVPALMSSYKTFAFLLATNILIMLNRWLYFPPKETRSKIYIYFTTILMLTALVLTFSNDSMLALAVGIILSIVVRWPNLAIHYIMASLFFFLALYFTGLLDYIYDSISSEVHYGEQRIRVQLAKSGIYGFVNRHYWIGKGFFEGKKYTSHFLGWPAHNATILTLDEIGILGLFSYLLPVGYTLLNLLLLNSKVSTPEDRAIARGLLFSMITLLIVFQSHAGYIDLVLWMYMAVIQGIVLLFHKGKAVRPCIERNEKQGIQNIPYGGV